MPKLEVTAKVNANITPLERAFAKAKKSGSDLGVSLKSTLGAAFSVAAVTAFARGIQMAAANIKDMAAQMQVTTDEAQQISHEAELIGVKFTDVRMVLNRLGEARRKAGEGDEEQLRLFGLLKQAMTDIQDPMKKDLALLKQIGGSIDILDPSQVSAFKGLFGVEAFKTIEAIKGLAQNRPIPLISKDELERIDAATKQFEIAYKRLQSIGATPLAGIFEHLGKAVTPGSILEGLQGLRSTMAGLTRGTALASFMTKRAAVPREGIEEVFSDDLFDSGKKERDALAKALEDLVKSQAALDFAGLDNAGKRLSIENQIFEQRKLANDAFPLSELQRREFATKINELELRLISMPLAKSTSPQELSQAISSDSLGRIGGVTGGTGAKRVEARLEKIDATLWKIHQRQSEPINLVEGL